MNNSRPNVNKVYIEVTNFCNFRCDFCPLRLSNRKRIHLDFDLYTKIIDDISGNEITKTVGFHILGEPLLYPHVFKAVRYARENGLRTEMTSNGSLLTQERVRGLAEAGLDRLTISLQRFGETDHEARRAPMPFDQYYERILEAVRLFGSSNYSTEVLVLFMNTATKRFFDVELPMRMAWDRKSFDAGLARVLRDINEVAGVEVTLEQASTVVGKLKTYQGAVFRIDENVLIAVRPFFDWGNAFNNDTVYPSRFGFCNLAFTSLGILSNGNVVICCADYEGDTSLGNIREHSMNEMLLAEKAQSIIEGLQHWRLVHPRCQNCFGSTNLVKTVFKSLILTGMFKIVKPGPGLTPKELTILND